MNRCWLSGLQFNLSKEDGFSTFLRGCNPAPAYIQKATKSVHYQQAKSKTIFTKQKIQLLLAP